MIPSHICVLESFPLSASGKVDRAKLPHPAEERYVRVPYRPPSDEYEKAIADIWQEVLKLPEIGVDDSFFELGGLLCKQC